MKLWINYDFFNAVRDVNDPLTPYKIIRNSPKYAFFTTLEVPMGHMMGLGIESIMEVILFWNAVYLSTDYLCEFMFKKFKETKLDSFAYEAMTKLRSLPTKLNDINIRTTYEMLLASELYERKYKIETTDDGLPTLKEEKYIYVPSYSYDGKEKETSILQEHYIGSGDYALSVGEPEKKYKRVLVKNQI